MIVDPYFLDHWKVKTIAGLLGKDEKAPLYIIRLWAYCQTAKKTTLPDNAEVVASVCNFKGHGDALLSAMIECKVLDRNEDGTLEVHGFSEWNASLYAVRKNAATAREALRQKRESLLTNDKAKGSPKVLRKTLPKDSTEGGLDRIGLDNTPKPPEGACVGWVSEFVSALLETGKTPAVTAEQVMLVNRDHPGADLEHSWPDVVTEITGLAAPAQNTVQVLRAALSRIEMRKTGGLRDGGRSAFGKNKEGGTSQSDGWPDQPEWMKEPGAARKEAGGA